MSSSYAASYTQEAPPLMPINLWKQNARGLLLASAVAFAASACVIITPDFRDGLTQGVEQYFKERSKSAIITKPFVAGMTFYLGKTTAELIIIPFAELIITPYLERGAASPRWLALDTPTNVSRDGVPSGSETIFYKIEGTEFAVKRAMNNVLGRIGLGVESFYVPFKMQLDLDEKEFCGCDLQAIGDGLLVRGDSISAKMVSGRGNEGHISGKLGSDHYRLTTTLSYANEEKSGNFPLPRLAIMGSDRTEIERLLKELVATSLQ